MVTVLLTIGGYESAFLADLVMAYILELIEDEDPVFFCAMENFNIYRESRLTMKPSHATAG
jgi:hypothetical protein